MSPFRSWWAEVENHSRQPSLQSSMSWWKRLSAQCSMLPPFLTDVSLDHQQTMQKPGLNPVQSATCLELHSHWWCCAKQRMGNPNDELLEPRKEGMSECRSFFHLPWLRVLERGENNFTSHTQSGKVRTSWGANRPAALAVGLQGIRWRMQKDLRENPNENVDFTAVLLSIPCFPNKMLDQKMTFSKIEKEHKMSLLQKQLNFLFSRQAPRARRTTRQANRTFWSSATPKLRKLFFFWRLKRNGKNNRKIWWYSLSIF